MATCATVRVYDGKVMILQMVVNADGYESHVGLQLAKFCMSRPLVSGIGDSELVFNGIGCFAAQLVSHLKGDRAGLWYIGGNEKQREEFNYKIIFDAREPKKLIFVSKSQVHSLKFKGAPEDFEAWLDKRG
jgi:hypothetical protein